MTAGTAITTAQPAGRTRPAGRRRERGIVTVELVFGILIVITVTALFGWIILLFGTQISAASAAEDVARQAARGDSRQVARAKQHAPQNAEIRIDRSGSDVHVTVHVRAESTVLIPTVDLHASAVAQKEPGEKGAR